MSTTAGVGMLACPDLNGDGLVQANDLLDFLWFWHAAQ